MAATAPDTAAAARGLLEPVALATLVAGWLKEDVPSFDVGGAVVGDTLTTATLYQKSPGVLAGVPFVEAVFAALGCTVEWLPVPAGAASAATATAAAAATAPDTAAAVAVDGADGAVPPPPAWPATYTDGTVTGAGGRAAVATVRGPARRLLLGERVALNTLARCSGVATAAHRLSTAAAAAGWGGRIAGTRKTTPGFRLVEKYGMLVGGADAHRMDLSSMVMLKDNHVAAVGGIARAVAAARRLGGFALKVEVECGSLDEALTAAAAGADVVMLDNMAGPAFVRAATALRAALGGRPLVIEGSGGLGPATVGGYFCEAADVLSMSLSQGCEAVDFSLKVAKPAVMEA